MVFEEVDYYPFGMTMPGRSYNADKYKYGFNGKENDNEVKGTGNQQDYGMRIYDPRLGKFLSVDPLYKEYPWNSTYAFAENSPIKFIDLDGLEKAKHWYDYDVNDLINWIGKPDNPFTSDGFLNKTATAVNRNINPLGIGVFNGYQLATGKDFATGEPASRVDALGNIVITGIFHQAGTQMVKPTAAMQLEKQMASNAAAMKTATKTATQAVAANSIELTESTLIGKATDFIRTETISGNKAARSVGANMRILNEGGSLAPIEVAHINGKNYVINGHHRLEAAMRSGSELKYQILTKEQWQTYGYKTEADIIEAAATTSKVKLDSKIIKQTSSPTP